MELKYDKIQTTGTDTPLKIVKGHFATNHAHTNYYFDLTTVKSRLSEAGGIAQALVHMYLYDMIVDTIVCMEGTEVIGTLLAAGADKRRFHVEERPQDDLRYQTGVQQQQPDCV